MATPTTKEKGDMKHILDMLKKEGHIAYYKALKNYRVKLTSEDIAPAWIVPAEHTIYFNKDKIKEYSDAKLSMLIRHELLHGLLDHVPREISLIANELGMDANNLSDDDILEIRTIAEKPNLNHAMWSHPVNGNLAGDMDLAKFYTDLDIEVAEDLGGILRQDYPEYDNLTYEEIYKKLQQEDKELRDRLIVNVHGHFDDQTGEWVDEYEDDYQFKTDKISISDIKYVTAPTVELLNSLDTKYGNAISNSYGYYWTKSEAQEGEFEDVVYVWHNYHTPTSEVINRHYALPVLVVNNLKFYENDKDYFTGFGRNWYPVTLAGHNFGYLVADKAIGECQYSKTDNTYKGSILEETLKAWFKQNVK